MLRTLAAVALLAAIIGGEQSTTAHADPDAVYGPSAGHRVPHAAGHLPAPRTAAGYAALWSTLPADEWEAADVSLSVPLGARVLWLYGDTVSAYFRTTRLVHSSAVVQDGGRLHVSRHGAQVLPNVGPVVYWIEAARAVDAQSVEITAAPMLLGTGGPWDFRRASALSRVALVDVDAAGDLTFRRWIGTTPAPPVLHDFHVLGPHHFTYGARPHPELRLDGGAVLWTVCQNRDDGATALADLRPIFTTRSTP